MKKILFLALISVAVMSCKMDGYTEYNLVSYSTFEYNILNFTDSLVLDASFMGGSSSYALVFNNTLTGPNNTVDGGFVLSMKRDSSLVIKADNPYPQYTMYATSAGSNSDVCAIFYQNPGSMPDHAITFNMAEYGTCTMELCQINNTQLTVHDVLADDSPLKFEPGDYLKLTIKGSLEGRETGSVEYYLADYRGGGEKIDSVLTSWKTISIAKLGNVEYVDFELETNKEGFPTYFCFDNLITDVYVRY